MASEKYNTWNPALYFQVCHGAFTGQALRDRTIAFTYTDRASKYDEIEWELDNGDGLLAAPEYLALGLTIRVRLGYLMATTPWKYFVINRVKGPIGIRDRTNTRGSLAVRKPGRGDARLTYVGRNRNAPLPKNPKKQRFAKPTSDLIGAEMNSANTLHRPRKIWAVTTGDVIKEIARRNGFTGPYAHVEPTGDRVEGLTIPSGMTDHAFCATKASEWGWVYKIDSYGLHFRSDEWSGAPRKNSVREVFTYGAGPDILELSVDGDFRLPVPTKVSVHGVDHQSRQRGQVAHAEALGRGARGEISSLAVQGMGAVGRILSGAGINSSRLQMEERLAALTTDEEIITVPDVISMASVKARRRFIDRHLNSFKIRLRVVGNPAMLAGQYVQLKGAGTRLIDGYWYVWEAKHVFSGETYTTDMTLRLPPKTKGDGSIQRTMIIHEESTSRGARNEVVSGGVRNLPPQQKVNRTLGYRKATAVD